MKMIDEDFILQYGKEKSVMRERNLMYIFDHFNIIKINHTWMEDEKFIFDVEYISNGSLHALIDKYKHIKGLYGLGKELTKIYMA